MAERKFVSPNRTLKYPVAMRVCPPGPVRLENTVREVIRLAKAGRNQATVRWYGKKIIVSQIIKACTWSDFVERGVWVDDLGTGTRAGSTAADFVLPQDEGSIYEYGPIHSQKVTFDREIESRRTHRR